MEAEADATLLQVGRELEAEVRGLNAIVLLSHEETRSLMSRPA